MIVFIVLLVLSGFLLSVPGDYWPWFAIMGGCAFVSVVTGSRWYRLAGIAGVVLSLALIRPRIHAHRVAGCHCYIGASRRADAATTRGTRLKSANRAEDPGHGNFVGKT
jgi:hypothetical protein